MAIKSRNADHDSAVRRVVCVGSVPLDPLATGDSSGRIYITGLGDENGIVERVSATVKTAPTGAALTVQIANGANDMLSSVLSMAAASASATSTSIDTTYEDVSEGDVLDIDIDQVGSTEAGEYLTVYVTVKVN